MQRRRGTQRSARGSWIWMAGVLVAGGLIGAAPARAGDDFERAFERELGRIAAHEVAHAGRHVAGAVGVGVHADGWRHRAARRHFHSAPRHGHAPGHYRGRGHSRWKHFRKHHARHGWGRYCHFGPAGYRHHHH